MKFKGFPARMEFTPVPNLFINQLAPEMSGAELKITLCLFKILYNKKGRPRFVSEADFLADPAVLASLQEKAGQPQETLKEILAMAVQQAILLPLEANLDGKNYNLYFLNSPADRTDLAGVQSGQFPLKGFKTVKPMEAAGEKPPDIFSLYEENIGLLTPMIGEELKDALATYPEAWLREAIKEAVTLNKRSWRYIGRILERWATEGKSNGTHQPDNSEENAAKFFRGRFGPLVQR
jgi:DNA replication protein